MAAPVRRRRFEWRRYVARVRPRAVQRTPRTVEQQCPVPIRSVLDRKRGRLLTRLAPQEGDGRGPAPGMDCLRTDIVRSTEILGGEKQQGLRR